jgi:hypothetical protein
MAKKSEGANVFKLEQLKASEKYRDCIDILSVVLEPEKEYTQGEVEAAIQEFRSAPVVEKRNGVKS